MTYSVRYSLLDPTGNRTILVETPVPPADQPSVAAALMNAEPGTEQVGFLSPADDCDIALRMAGGEFCGNAAMCAAVCAAVRRGVSQGRFTVRVSGAEAPVPVSLSALPDGGWRGTVNMPRPGEATPVSFPQAGTRPVVRFDGIAHVILETSPDRVQAETLAPLWCRQLSADALGMLFLDRKAGTLTPLVYVPAAGTLCWENSCASGTTAVGAWLAGREGVPLSIALRQPGGTLEISVSPEGDLALTGTVRALRQGSRAIPL